VAARAYARRSAKRGKRRPGRRPAARRGGSRIRWDRVGRLALTFVLAAVLYSYLNPAIDFVKTYTATTAAKAQLQRKLDENKLLHYTVQHSDDPAFLAGRARAQGMTAEGERPLRVHGLPPHR
jgi:hypothetical protein